MVDANVKLTAEAVSAYNDLHSRKIAYTWIRMGFSDDLKQVELQETGGPDATFSELLAVVPKDRTSFIVYNLEYKTLEGQHRNPVLIVTYSDDDTNKAKEKMLASSTTKQVKTQCKNFNNYACINDRSDLDYENFIKIVSKK